MPPAGRRAGAARRALPLRRTARRGCSTGSTCACRRAARSPWRGPSGAGKTTLAELLVRFRDPTAGASTLGGARPAPARRSPTSATPYASLRRTPTSSPRACARTSRSARAEADGREIAAALRRVGLGAWLASLPDGLATAVGEHGAQVSGGQRERIAAARLLLRTPASSSSTSRPRTSTRRAREALLAELAAAAREQRARRARHHPRARRPRAPSTRCSPCARAGSALRRAGRGARCEATREAQQGGEADRGPSRPLLFSGGSVGRPCPQRAPCRAAAPRCRNGARSVLLFYATRETVRYGT